MTSAGKFPLASSKYTKLIGPQIQDFGLISNWEPDTTGGAMPIVQCDSSVGFTFINVSLITIKNVVFNGCGLTQPSTSLRKENNEIFWEFIIGLTFINCSGILFDHVWINNTNGIGTFLFSSFGNNVFQNSRFYSNSAMKNETYPAGGGLYVEYSSCLPTTPTLCTKLTEYKPSSLTIDNCIFEDNSGEVSNNVSISDVWQIPSGSAHSSIGRGGGLSITFEGESNNIQVLINKNSFNRNRAYWGGGLFVEFHDNANHNTLNVISSNFTNNSVKSDKEYGSGGGGVRIGVLFLKPSHVFNNSITFEHCYFVKNTAKWGGGVSFYTTREYNVLEPSNRLHFLSCQWWSNTAWLGAAVDLDVWHADNSGLPMLVEFSNTNVESNLAFRADWMLLGVGIIYTDTIPILFSGKNNFYYNYGSALVASSSSITFKNTNSFTNNYGRNGGAIQLSGNAFIIIGNQTELIFDNNTAEQKGGAIFVQTVNKHDLFTLSPNCFVHHEDVNLPPNDWESSVSFVFNTAYGKDNSIYVTTTNACKWHDKPNVFPGSYGSALCWKHWSYANQTGPDYCNRQIESDPKDFTTKSFIPSKLFVTPGIHTTLPDQYHVVDDFGNNANERLVLTASILTAINLTDKKPIEATATIQQFITNNTFTMYGKTNNNYSIKLYTIDPRVVYTSVQVDLLPCPFGFVNNVVQNKSFSCVCERNKASFNGIVECSQVNFSSSLTLLGQWAGYNKVTGHRVAGYSPYTGNLNKTQQTLPSINQTRDPGDYFCYPVNRKDVLCGKCKNNTGPAINSENYKCVECNPNIEYYSWLLYVVSEILPLTAFFVILIMFNISLTSGMGNAFVFFSQIVTTTFGIYTASNEPYHSLREAYRFVYGIWNLDIFSALPFFQYCLSPNLDTMTIILLEYVIAFYPLVVIIILYSLVALCNRGVRPVIWLCTPLQRCFIRLRNRVWNPTSSLIDAIAAFILLSYSRMAQTSIKLLRYSSLYHENGSLEHNVVYYDGTMLAYQGKHLIYVVIALLILVVFVAIPPLVLIFFSTKRIHRLISPFCTISGGRLEQFLNAFYGSYKDGAGEGTNDYRVFAGLYLIYRIVFPLVRFFSHDWQMIYLLQNVFCLLAVFMFLALRPYRNDMHNKFDACIFSILLFVSLLNQYNFNQVYLESDQSIWLTFILEYMLIWTPVVVISCYLLYKLCKKYNKLNIIQLFKRKVERFRTTLFHSDTQVTIANDNSILEACDKRQKLGSIKTSNSGTEDLEGQSTSCNLSSESTPLLSST